MLVKISSKHLFTVGLNQFKISRTDYFNKSCNAFFRWYRTDAQVLFLAEKIALNLVEQPDIYGKEIRIDFEIKEEGTYALFLILTQKANAFFEIKLTNFIKSSKIKEKSDIKTFLLEGYKYAYKLVPRESDHFFAIANLEGLRYKIYFSSHLIHKKEHFFKKYNFQRLANDVLKYLVTNNLTEPLSDGTPLGVKAKPTIDNETINHILHVACSLWHNEKAEDEVSYIFLVDSVRYLSSLNRAINVDNFFIDNIFELNKVKELEIKEKPKGLKIVKKKAFE